MPTIQAVVSEKKIYPRKNNQINYFTVQSYKGLESSVVFYIDGVCVKKTPEQRFDPDADYTEDKDDEYKIPLDEDEDHDYMDGEDSMDEEEIFQE